ASVWNPVHPIVRLAEAAGWEWCLEKFESTLDPLSVRDTLLSKPSRAASWILLCLQRGQHDLWNGLLDRDPSFLKDLWNTVSSLSARINPGIAQGIFQFVEEPSDSRLRRLSPTGWTAYRSLSNAAELKEYLPQVTSDWQLEIQHK